MQSIRIIEFPECRMVSSGTGMFGQEKFERFNEWFSSLSRSIYPKDFLLFDGAGFCWLYIYDDSLKVPEDFEITQFKGGLYAVATDIDQQTDVEAMDKQVDDFLAENGFMRDNSRFRMGNIITSPHISEVLGYNQMDYYAPIKPIESK